MIKARPYLLADGTERASTGAGPPGAHIRRQHEEAYTQQRSEVSDYGEALGMEPDNDMCE
jgi:hypothetical protein